MGLYINPTDCSKEEWLARFGTLVIPGLNDKNIQMTRDARGVLTEFPVCLIDNGLFQAVIICYSTRELREVINHGSSLKKWFTVSTEKLLEVQPDLKNYLNRG
jgi:hypothetical protein